MTTRHSRRNAPPLWPQRRAAYAACQRSRRRILGSTTSAASRSAAASSRRPPPVSPPAASSTANPSRPLTSQGCIPLHERQRRLDQRLRLVGVAGVDQRPAELDLRLPGLEHRAVVVEQRHRPFAERQRLFPSPLLATQPAERLAVQGPGVAEIGRQLAGGPAQLPARGGAGRSIEQKLGAGAAHLDQQLPVEKRLRIAPGEGGGDLSRQVDQPQRQQGLLAVVGGQQLPDHLE